jgi:hypothetical protein
VTINEEAKSAFVVVPDNQLSLAIGKAGQNVRLAARLTGWRIDIRSEAQVARAALLAMTEQLNPSEEAEEEAESVTVGEAPVNAGGEETDLVIGAPFDNNGHLPANANAQGEEQGAELAEAESLHSLVPEETPAEEELPTAENSETGN